MIGCKAQRRQPGAQHLEGNAPVETGQRRAGAEVDPVAETEMAPALPSKDIEPVGVSEGGVVPVGGRHHRPESVAGPNLDTGELAFGGGRAEETLGWSVHPQDFLDGL